MPSGRLANAAASLSTPVGRTPTLRPIRASRTRASRLCRRGRASRSQARRTRGTSRPAPRTRRTPRRGAGLSGPAGTRVRPSYVGSPVSVDERHVQEPELEDVVALHVDVLAAAGRRCTAAPRPRDRLEAGRRVRAARTGRRRTVMTSAPGRRRDDHIGHPVGRERHRPAARPRTRRPVSDSRVGVGDGVGLGDGGEARGRGSARSMPRRSPMRSGPDSRLGDTTAWPQADATNAQAISSVTATPRWRGT